MAGAISTYRDHTGPIARLSQISGHLATCLTPLITNVDSENFLSASPQEPRDIPPPSMILLFAWIGASTSAISRYVTRYSTLYPSAPVIIFSCPSTYFFPWPISAQWQREEGLETLFHTLASSATDNRVLVHAFSNGGSYRFANIAAGYYSTTHTPLPIRTLVLDSGPAVSGIRIKASVVKNTVSSNRLVRLVVHAVMLVATGAAAAWSALTRQHEPTAWTRQILNDPLYVSPTASRVYIYSTEDQVIDYTHVEEHAEAARRRGYPVRSERFHGSGHVCHAKLDQKRYWSIISRLWDTAGDGQGNHTTAGNGDASKRKLE